MPEKLSRSWVVVTWSSGSQLLHGGVKRATSCRWGDRAAAQSYMESTLDINRQSGIACDGEIQPSDGFPELFRHCGGEIGAIGGLCAECRKLLTEKDARLYCQRKSSQV